MEERAYWILNLHTTSAVEGVELGGEEEEVEIEEQVRERGIGVCHWYFTDVVVMVVLAVVGVVVVCALLLLLLLLLLLPFLPPSLHEVVPVG